MDKEIEVNEKTYIKVAKAIGNIIGSTFVFIYKIFIGILDSFEEKKTTKKKK